MIRTSICVLLLAVAVFSQGADANAARRRNHHSQSNAISRYRGAIRARQQQLLNDQKLMVQWQQALAKQRAEDLARRRQLSQLEQQREAQATQHRRETLKTQRTEHDAQDRDAGITHGSPEEVLKNYDRNSDGFLTAIEVANSPTALRFAELDANHDEKLTLPELRASQTSSQ